MYKFKAVAKGVVMPSGYTHSILALEFNERSGHSNQGLTFLLREKIRYFQLGALGPDLPYSQQIEFNGQAEVADKLHYNATNLIPLKAFEKIRNLKTSAERDEIFCFFLGYMSHIVADGVIHPFIRDKVGDYAEHSAEHRALEMKLDVILLNEFSAQKSGGSGLNLNDTKMHDQIIDPLNTGFLHLAGLFAELINTVHDTALRAQDVENWVRGMHRIFSFAEGNNNQFYAWLPVLETYLFHDKNEVLKNKDKYLVLKSNEAVGREMNFLKKDVHFINDCIPMFYKAFTPVALAAYRYVYENGTKVEEAQLPAINLDTGRDLRVSAGNDLDRDVVFWGQA